jgi:hypothetical protein
MFAASLESPVQVASNANQKKAARMTGDAIATSAAYAGTVAIRIGGWAPATPMPFLLP